MAERAIQQKGSNQHLTTLQMLVHDALSVPAGVFTPAVADKAAMCLLDFLSCAFESAHLPWSQQAAKIALPLADGSVIIGDHTLRAMDDAAFANAVRGHGLVREDMHAGSIAHLGVVVWPVLMALAGTRPISGERLIRAAVTGYEAGGRVGRVLMTPEVARLFRPTGLVGPLAAVMAGAILLELDEATTVSALALAANCSSGLNEWPHNGADEMYFHPGFVSRNALMCLRLAQAGADASASILEGPAGLFAAFGRLRHDAPIRLFPEGDAEIMHVFNKQVPACNFAQSPCQAALRALKQSGRESGAIKAVRVDTYDAALNYPGCAHTGPFARPLQAKMSIPFGVASALTTGEIAESNYARLDDPEIARLIAAMRFNIDEAINAAFPARQGTRVTLEFTDGDSTSVALDDIEFADKSLIERRFLEAAGQTLGEATAEAIRNRVNSLPRQSDSGSIIRLCRTGAA
jgi:2-methylcitrate dehydratase PrpD